MVCPHCGTENPAAFGYCSACGRPLSTIEGVAPPPPLPTQASGSVAGAAPALAPVIAQPKPMSPVAMLAVAAVVALILFLGTMLPVDEENEAVRAGYRFGRTFAALLLPFLIAYPIAGRKKARKPNQFALIFCLAGVFFIGANALGSVNLESFSETPEQHVGRLMREAAGLQPVHEPLFPGQRRVDDALRDQFRNLVRLNREYAETVSKMDVSQIKNINTPESFMNPGFAAGGLQQLHALYDADTAQEAKVKEIVDNLRRTLESSASSASERESVVKGFDEAMAAQMSKRTAVVTSEKAWMDAVDEEYAYANQRSGDFRSQNARLVIPDAAIRQEFNGRVDAQEARRQEFLLAQKAFQQFQAQTLQKMGVKPNDIGGK